MSFRQAEQRFRYSYVVVEVALGGHHLITFGQHGTDEFLRGRFAVGACDAYHRYLELSSVFAGKVFEGLQTVVNKDEALPQVIRKVCLL